MSPSPILTFGACELNLPLRELRLDGQVQALAPRVFDLIAFLVDQRHRIVTKDELQRAVWANRNVSDSAIARAVMLARRAIGDGSLIRTVQRVGYRFVGEVAVSAAVATAPPPMRRLGVLPVDNRTGEPHLDWVTLGVAALVQQSLEADRRLSLPTVPEMLAALASLPPQAPAAERAAAVQRYLGVPACVHTVLRRQGQVLWLDYQGYGEHLERLVGSLSGDDPVELGQRLARELSAALVPPSDGSNGSAVPAAISKDPFICQAYARAAQLQATHQFRAASRLLAVVLEFEPDCLPAQLARLRTLANLEDPRTDALAAEVAGLAASKGDRRGEALAWLAAGHRQLLSETPGSLDRSAELLDRALGLAAPFAHEDWVVRMRLLGAGVAVLRGDMARARRWYGEVLAASTSAENHFQLGMTLDNLAWLDSECGEWLQAQAGLERALAIYRRHKMHSAAALTLFELAVACVELGLWRLARDHASEGEALLHAVQQPHVVASIAECAAFVHAETGSLADIDRVLHRLQAETRGLHTATEKAEWQAALALRALAADQPAPARAAIGQALRRAEATGSPVRCARRLRQCLELELRWGEADDRASAVKRATDLLATHDDPELRALLACADAVAAHERSDASAALAALRRAIELAPAGRVQALARLDAATLCRDLGERGAFEECLRPIGPWREGHPRGLALARGSPLPLFWARHA